MFGGLANIAPATYSSVVSYSNVGGIYQDVDDSPFVFECPTETISDCTEDSNCDTCQAWGSCTSCASDYVKIDDKVPCLHCVNTFGDGTLQCQEYNGAQTCDNGYSLTWTTCNIDQNPAKPLAYCFEN